MQKVHAKKPTAHKKPAAHHKKAAAKKAPLHKNAKRTITTTAPRKATTAFKSMKATTPTTTFNTPTASFHQTKRMFSEPQATAPAAIDNIAPEVQNIVDGIMKLNIMQTLQLVKILKAEFGYSDAAFAMPVAAAPGAGAGGAAAAAEEEKPKAATKTAFNVKLESFDAGSKVKIIKEVRTITGLGLKEAKELVETSMAIISKDVKKEDAEAIIKTLKEVGAVCVME